MQLFKARTNLVIRARLSSVLVTKTLLHGIEELNPSDALYSHEVVKDSLGVNTEAGCIGVVIAKFIQVSVVEFSKVWVIQKDFPLSKPSLASLLRQIRSGEPALIETLVELTDTASKSFLAELASDVVLGGVF